MTGALAAAAAILLSYGLFLSNGRFTPFPGVYRWECLAMVLVALALAIAAASARWSSQANAKARRWLPAVLGLLAAASVEWLIEKSPARRADLVPGFSHALYRAAIGLVALVELSYLWKRACPARLRFPLLVALYLAIGVWIIRSAPSPLIDVWVYEQRAADLLLKGQNPYSAEYPNIYADATLFGPELMKGNQIVGHTYPPLSVLLMVPGRLLLGDVRYVLLAAVAGASILLVAAGRRLGTPAGHPIELAAVMLMFHGRGFFVVGQAWSEPLLALAAAAVLYALVARVEVALGLALGALLSAKQYGVLVLPALWGTRRLGVRALGIAIVASAVVAAPFLFWNPVALWNGVVTYQMKLAFRADALSVPSAIFALTGHQPRGLGFLAAAAVAVAVLWRASRADEALSIARACAAAAATLIAFFAFDKGFLNYYWVAEVLLLFAAAVDGAPEAGTSAVPVESRAAVELAG